MVEHKKLNKQRLTVAGSVLCLMLCGLVLTYAAPGFAADGDKELLKEALTQGREDADMLKEKKEAADKEKRLDAEAGIEKSSILEEDRETRKELKD